jgi:MacB-like periplasmic core domain
MWKDLSFSLRDLRKHPGLVATAILSLTLDNGWEVSFEVFGRPSGQQERLRANFLSLEYFSVPHIPLLQGRLMDQSEVARGARLAVINQTMARQYWPTGDALGRQLRTPTSNLTLHSCNW